MKHIAGLVAALALVACASTSWTKEGTTPEVVAKDLSECNSVAATASERDSRINQDILATRGKDWQDTGALFTVQQTYAAQNQEQSSDIVSRCMISKGYAPGG
ncbi:MAG: hypothetical protein KGL11_13090 [Alphaproteobacteria bacterium]|nr:hypothetical protein [Alphaproteobacteria bacterium]